VVHGIFDWLLEGESLEVMQNAGGSYPGKELKKTEDSWSPAALLGRWTTASLIAAISTSSEACELASEGGASGRLDSLLSELRRFGES